MKIQRIAPTSYSKNFCTQEIPSGAPETTNYNQIACNYTKAQSLALKNIAFGMANKAYEEDYADKAIAAMKKVIEPAIENEDVDGILTAFGYNTSTNEDGKIILHDNYSGIAFNNFSFEDFGIDEDMLLKHIVQIDGDADFSESNATSTQVLERVGKNLYLLDSNSSMESMPNLTHVGGNAYFCNSLISPEDFTKDINIEHNAYFNQRSDDNDTFFFDYDFYESRHKHIKTQGEIILL